MSEDVVKIEIYDGIAQSGCSCSSGCSLEGGCGSTVAESVEKLKKEMLQAYGEKVEVDFIDTANRDLNSFPLISRVVQMGYSFPIIAINGQPRMAGGIDFNQVKKLLDEMQEQ